MAKLLTDLTIRRFRTPSARREIADAKVEGLALIIQPTGSKAWSYRYRYGRRQRRITLGTWPAIDLMKARARAEDAVRALERGDDPGIALFKPKAAQYIPSADRDAFGVVVRRFMLDHAVPHLRGWRERARQFGLKVIDGDDGKPAFEDVPGRLTARWAEKPIGSITGRDIIDVIDATKARGAAVVANRELAAIKKLFTWAIGKRIIDANPAAGIPAPTKETARDRVLTDDELRLIWGAAEGEGFPFGDIVKLLVLTAQRRLEVAGAAWAEIDRKGKTWLLPSARTKNKKAHIVPLSDAALGVLGELPRIGAYLFGLGGKTPFSGFSAAKARLDVRMAELADADMIPWTLHDLRRTAATRMAGLGVQPIVIEAALNHISGARGGLVAVYNVYAYEAEKRDALTRWAEHIEKLVDPDAKEASS
jgi:integrase